MKKISIKASGLTWMILGSLVGLSLQGRAQTLTPELNSRILKAGQGSVVELPGFLTEKTIRSLDYQKIVLPGPQFIISDDPEYIRVPEGIALRQSVQPGSVRLYLYNVNGVNEPKKMPRKITAVIKNTGKDPLHIRIVKYSSQKPSSNYFKVAKQGLADYFASRGQSHIRTVKPGAAIPIDERSEKNVALYDELVHGFYEFVIDQPAEINIIQTDPQTSGTEALKRLKTVLPSSGKNAGRGVFGISNYQVIPSGVVDTKNGPVQLILADGEKDPWVIGKDDSQDKPVNLDGNYGVMYHVNMKWKSTDGKGLALVTWNARADNQWCNGMIAGMVVSKGKFREGIVQLPSDRLLTKGTPEAILVQVFPPAGDGKEQNIQFTYSPPGATCLPTPLVLIPVDMK
ncbi:MAG: copper amine oxidase [Flavisolibacter sp.]